MDKTSFIKEKLQVASYNELPSFISEYSSDERKAVMNLVESARKKMAAYEKELARLENMRVYEHKYEDQGLICGIDEVGRGPLAGPVVAGAVILPKDCEILYINDSKQLSEKKREELYAEIMEKAIATDLLYYMLN